jgi:hypothetical protein
MTLAPKSGDAECCDSAKSENPGQYQELLDWLAEDYQLVGAAEHLELWYSLK